MGSFQGWATLQLADLQASVEVDLRSTVDQWSGLIEWSGTFFTADHARLLPLVDAHRALDEVPLHIQLAGDDDVGQVIITRSNGWDGDLRGLGDPPIRLRSP
jgi:hypothetical protein